MANGGQTMLCTSHVNLQSNRPDSAHSVRSSDVRQSLDGERNSPPIAPFPRMRIMGRSKTVQGSKSGAYHLPPVSLKQPHWCRSSGVLHLGNHSVDLDFGAMWNRRRKLSVFQLKKIVTNHQGAHCIIYPLWAMALCQSCLMEQIG